MLALKWEAFYKLCICDLYNNVNISFVLFSCTVPRPWTSVADELYNTENRPRYGRGKDKNTKAWREVTHKWIKHCLSENNTLIRSGISISFLIQTWLIKHAWFWWFTCCSFEPFGVALSFRRVILTVFHNEAVLEKCWVMSECFSTGFALGSRVVFLKSCGDRMQRQNCKWYKHSNSEIYLYYQAGLWRNQNVWLEMNHL